MPARAQILVVDDEEPIRTIATLALQMHNLEVHTAADGEQALAIMARMGSEIDVVVLDLSMPEMSGREVYHRLRATWKGPVLFQSGYRADERVADELLEPHTTFLPKPWTITTLVEAVTALLPEA